MVLRYFEEFWYLFEIYYFVWFFKDVDIGINLYGYYLFYLMMEDGGRSYGFFFLNSNVKGKNRRYKSR